MSVVSIAMNTVSLSLRLLRLKSHFHSNCVNLGSLSEPQAPHFQNVIDNRVCVLNEIIQEKILAWYLTHKKYSVMLAIVIVRCEGEFSLYSRAFLYYSHSDLLLPITI